MAAHKRGTSDSRLLSARLERCAREFLAQDRVTEAWECALMADAGAIDDFTGS